MIYSWGVKTPLLKMHHHVKKIVHFHRTTIRYSIGILVVAAIFLGIFSFSSRTELRIYTWEDYIAPSVIASFEKKYRVKVTLHEFESVFDLVRAYRENPNLDTYDLIFFGDNVAEELRRIDVLSPIEKSKIPNIRHIASKYLDSRVNAEGLHVVPYMFGTTGIVYNRKYIDPETVDWSTLFEEKYAATSCILNDEAEVIAAAAFAEGYDAVPVDDTAMRDTTALIQKYTDRDGTYCSDIALVDELVSEHIWIAQDWNGSAIPALEENPALAYVIPERGGQLWYDNMAIPRGAHNIQNAMRFIDYINQPKIAAENVEYLRYASVNDTAREYLDAELLTDEIIYPSATIQAKLKSYTDYPYYEAVAAMRDDIHKIMQQGNFIKY